MAENDAGNAAVMRAVLEDVVKYLGDIIPTRREIELINSARAALAAPARNCDVGTAKEQAERFKAFCLPRILQCSENSTCPSKHPCNEIGIQYCQLKWAQLPYEEGAGK